MIAPVNVLAVLDRAVMPLPGTRGDLREARAAVARLIETSAAALQYMRLHQYADQAWADDLAAALAAVGAQQPEAQAGVAHATASNDAEIERLRGALKECHSLSVARWRRLLAAEAEIERLQEACKRAEAALTKLGEEA